MSFVAIIGSGALGGAVAHTLALGDRVREIRLIDSEDRIAQGKALDILQSAPIDQFTTAVVATGSIAAAAGAAAIVIADAASGSGEFGSPRLNPTPQSCSRAALSAISSLVAPASCTSRNRA